MAEESEYLAAIDLGSNSFHMIIGHIIDGNLHIIDRIREMVRLATGLTDDDTLDQDARDRAIACLKKFGQRLREFPPCSVHAVGTNTMRKARNAENFSLEAQEALGHPINIISGVEEARLVFLGVAHSLGNHEQKRLVVDIGGGSTELIIGQHFTPEWLESFYMGCVSFSMRFFADGVISERNMMRAEIYAHIELEHIKALVKKKGWSVSIGTSGTIRAIQSVIIALDNSHCITLDRLNEIRRLLIKAGNIENLSLKGLKPERNAVFPGGLAILIAVFEALGIEKMDVSSGALREGLIYDQLERTHDKDIREKTVDHFMHRFQVDTQQTSRVLATAEQIISHVGATWGLDDPELRLLMSFAIQLHEIGFSIAHSQHHRHGAYLAEHADMAGFSLQEQRFLAALIRTHRRKIPFNLLKELPKQYRQSAIGGCVIFRIAVLLHRNRSDSPLPILQFTAEKKSLTIQFPTDWLANNPLTETDFDTEQAFLKAIKFELNFQ